MSSPAPQNSTPGPSNQGGSNSGAADNSNKPSTPTTTNPTGNNDKQQSQPPTPQQQQQQQPPQQQQQPQQSQQQQPPQQQQQKPSAANLPSQDDLDKIVASYLQKKGYKATGSIFARESSGNTLSLEDLSKVLTSSGAATQPGSSHVTKYKDVEEGDPDAYNISYRNLREWIEKSLDWYKVKKKKK